MNYYGIKVKLNNPEREEHLMNHEREKMNIILNNIQGKTLFDIGAERGDMSAIFAKVAKEIVLFEPSPSMWTNIKYNFELNNLKSRANYVGFASGITDEKPKHLDYDDKDNHGWPECACKEKDETRTFRHVCDQAVSTKQITLDDFCEREKVYPDVLTIDVEGAEYNVLIGMPKILERKEPIVFMSIHHDLLYTKYGKWFSDIYYFFRNFGYKAHFIHHDHESHFVFYKKSFINVKEII